MEFDAHFRDILIKLLVSALLGTIVGAERECRNKSAGLRTMMLICLGSSIFTIISIENSHETEVARIASNIVTGIGFIGAGAIMRDGLSISGLTTASTIWAVAALGMAVGFGDFQMALAGTALVMIVLILFNYLERIYNIFQRTMKLRLTFRVASNSIEEMEKEIKKLRIRSERLKEKRQEGDVIYEYELKGSSKKLDALISYLVAREDQVKAFEY
jgi:putative Mg2+ transporter-C (MgtC) family protein